MQFLLGSWTRIVPREGLVEMSAIRVSGSFGSITQNSQLQRFHSVSSYSSVSLPCSRLRIAWIPMWLSPYMACGSVLCGPESPSTIYTMLAADAT
jgi:hypothetical protein